MSRMVFLLLFIATSIPVFADLTKTVEIEQNLETRIYRAVAQVDPGARVNVKVVLKDVKVQLPGLNVDYLGPTSVNKIVGEDVESIKVRIVSALDPFPEWLKSDLQSGFTFGSIRTEFEFAVYSPDALELIQKQNVISKSIDQLVNYSGRMWPLALVGVGIFFAVIMTALAVFVLWTSRFWREQVTRLTQAVESGGSAGPEVATPDRAREEPSTLFKGVEGGLDLPEAGLMELLADCYWTELDGYAKWVWDQLKAKQREYVLEHWTPMAEYAGYIQDMQPRTRADHAHPYYFKPLSLKHCGPKELAQLVMKSPEVWHALSPIRRAKLDVPLAKRVTMIQSPVKPVVDATFEKIKSTPRVLKGSQFFGHVSLNDESEIFRSPTLIPVAMRTGVPTLVWAALLEPEARREFLSVYSANELAQCWVGPEDVLAKLREVVPEKKMKLIDSYLSNRQPSRESDLFLIMTAEAANRLTNKDKVEKTDGQKAA